MNVRKSVVAGRFYPGSAKDLQGMIAMCLSGASTFFGPNAPVDKDTQDTPCMLMLPHAGYIFSAPVACAALLGTRLPKTVIVLCPNHTGYGRSRFGVWPNGAWETPLGSVPVNAELAQKLAEKTPFGADTLCHALCRCALQARQTRTSRLRAWLWPMWQAMPYSRGMWALW